MKFFRKRSVSMVLVLIFILGFTVSAMAEPNILPGGPFLPPEAEVGRESILNFEEIETRLLRLEAQSKGAMELKVIGESIAGRPLYAAVIGEGDTRMWIHGRIHGNEPYGAEASLDLLSTLVAGGKKAQNVLEEMTFMIIPVYNPDGSERYRRANDNNVDLNRDWAPSGSFNFRQPESQQFYAAFYEFKPHYAIDLHHQGTYFVDDTNLMSTLSLGISMYINNIPEVIRDTVRQMAVVAYDATDKLGYCNTTRYPSINIPGGVVSAMMLGTAAPGYEAPDWNTAAIFFESRGGIQQVSRGYLIRQNVVGLWAVIDAIVSGELSDADPERWMDIPPRPRTIRNSDKWPSYEGWYDDYEEYDEHNEYGFF